MNADYVTNIVPSPYHWLRLTISLLLSTIACVGMWSAVVALPAVQADFGIDRATASLPFTFAFSGFAIGGALMGRLADRFGIIVPVTIGAVMLGFGYVSSSFSVAAWQYSFAYGVIGVGSSAAFAPLMADISHWFDRQRGMAVAIVSCGSLPRRNDLTTHYPVCTCERRLAADSCRHRRVVDGNNVATDIFSPQASCSHNPR